ncbi:MAG: ATP-binding protein [Clostridia bacterium]|nr:ATP-binding protein [Clostridia bacterium]
MRLSLRTKLSVSYILVALVCVALISFLTNVFLEKQFRQYVINNQERKNKEFVNLISQQYRGDDKWENNNIEHIGVSALEQGMIIKVRDISGKMVWDATVHNNGLCKQMIAHMAHNMYSRYPNFDGGYVINTYPLMHDMAKVGSVEIGYYGPFYFNDNDLTFINTLNKLLIGVGAMSLFFALALGAIMARKLSTPISRVINTAQMISKGYFGDRITEKSDTREICQLTETVNGLAETLEKQENLRKRLTADVAHELRTPLATLQSHMEAMIDGIWKPDSERLKSCHEEIVRISRLVGDIEKLSRYESENLILNSTEFDISELVGRIVKNFEGDFIGKGIEVELHTENEQVFADKDKMSQVLVNLISNALKYTPEGGKIEINVKGADDITEIVVKDNGVGISANDLPHIFERFYRADKSRNRMTGGAGIGLTITKAIIEAHKGNITVQSKVNEGTEVVVSLPKQVG